MVAETCDENRHMCHGRNLTYLRITAPNNALLSKLHEPNGFCRVFLASVFRPYGMIIVAVRRLTRRFVEVKVRRLIMRRIIKRRIIKRRTRTIIIL